MKVKTSVTISQELRKVMDEFFDADNNRSLFLAKAAWAYIAKLRRAQRNARDLVVDILHPLSCGTDDRPPTSDDPYARKVLVSTTEAVVGARWARNSHHFKKAINYVYQQPSH